MVHEAETYLIYRRTAAMEGFRNRFYKVNIAHCDHSFSVTLHRRGQVHHGEGEGKST